MTLLWSMRNIKEVTLTIINFIIYLLSINFTVFSVNPPARSCFQVGKLPRNGLVEIEAVALTGNVETVLIHKL